MRVYHDFVLVPGSRSTFPDADLAKWYRSDRIRIRNTASSLQAYKNGFYKVDNVFTQLFLLF